MYDNATLKVEDQFINTVNGLLNNAKENKDILLVDFNSHR